VINVYSNDRVHVKDQYFGHWKYHPEIEYNWPEVVVIEASADFDILEYPVRSTNSEKM
jgi:hypothetical protein